MKSQAPDFTDREQAVQATPDQEIAAPDLPTLAAKADEIAAMLRTMGNDKRLLILCKLVEHGEVRVGPLSEMIELSQSALSQHLAKMRNEGLVDARRESQTMWYRVADPRIEELIATLYRLYCA